MPQFRPAQRQDTQLILTFIKELASYEKMLDQAKLCRILEKNGVTYGRL